MSLGLHVRVDAENLPGVQTALLMYPRQARVALRRAINKTLGWTRTQGGRAIAQEHGLPLKVLRARRRIVVSQAHGDNLFGVAWFGLKPIKAMHLGKPRQTGTGTAVGSRFFDGAFIARMPSGHLGVFKRAGQSRLPIAEQTVDLYTSSSALRRIAGQVPGRLRTVFRQELNYAVNVRRAA